MFRVAPSLGPDRPLVHPATRWAACLLFVTISLPILTIGRGERSGWILMTSPETWDHRGNPLLGYSFLRGGEPFMKEDIPAATQVGLFSGVRDATRLSEFRQDFRFIRGYGAFLATLLAPALGILGAQLAVNWLAWALAAWVAWRLTLGLSGSGLAALFAVLLVAGGTGMILHVGDGGPHLLAFATFYLGVWLVYVTDVYRARRPWIVHARLGVAFAIASLVYNTGVMLAAVYCLTALRCNRKLHVVGAAAVALSARPLWQLLLGPSVVDVEADYFLRALAYWWNTVTVAPLYTVRMAVTNLSEFFVFFDSPLVVVAGIASVFLVPLDGSRRWLAGCTLLIPLCVSFPFSSVACARGYLVYPVTLWLYACLAWQLVRMARGGGPRRGAAWALAAAILVSHFAWSTAHLWHFLGPAKTYFVGWDHGWPALIAPPAEVASLTGAEPAPVLFGGTASLTEAGARVTAENHMLRSNQVSFLLAVAARGWFFGYAGFLGVLVARSLRGRLLAVGVTAVTMLGTAGLSWATTRTLPAFFHVDCAVVVPPQARLSYRVELSPRTLAMFRRHARDDDRLAFFLRADPMEAAEVTLRAGATAWNATHSQFFLLLTLSGPEVDQALAAMAASGEIALELSNPSPREMAVTGWQRADLTGRTCMLHDARGEELPRPETLPTLEIRLLDPRGRIKAAAF